MEDKDKSFENSSRRLGKYVIRCPQGKLELVQGLPLLQGQEFATRKSMSLCKEDDDSSSHDHQEKTPTAHCA